MAINGINGYRDTLYHWQSQQLRSTGSTSANNSSSSAINMLFGGSTSMISQINSMVELTKYAMDAMGVSPDARVTFSQITKYREQLQSEFNEGVRKGLENSGISDVSALSFTLDRNGKLTAIGENETDRKTAQAWLDANPAYGQDILKNLPADVFESVSEISFSLSSAGRLTVTNSAQDRVQTILNQKGDLADNARSRMKTAGMDYNYPLEFSFDENGDLTAKGNAAVSEWLKENPEPGAEIKKILADQKVEPSAVSLRLGSQGALQITVNDAELNEIQEGLDKSRDTGERLIQGLNNLGIDRNINFSIQIDANGNFKVISDHPDTAKLQKFFDDNPELVKKYRQIETLAGIDDARKAMQISPSAMRKRIQIESMAAWWSESGNSNSYFGNYSDNNLALLSGLNIKI